MTTPQRFSIRHFSWKRRTSDTVEYQQIRIGAGECTSERIVPPAGDDYAFTVDTWSCNVEITVSPSGRSVQVFVDGERVR